MDIHSRYNPSPKPKTEFSEEDPKSVSRCKQSFRDEVNINTIVKRGLTHDPSATRQPQYGDFSNGGDYKQMCDAITQAQSEFMQLPSDTRYRFNNDVGEMLDWVANPENHAEAAELGIIPKGSKPNAPDQWGRAPVDTGGASSVDEGVQPEETPPGGGNRPVIYLM